MTAEESTRAMVAQGGSMDEKSRWSLENVGMPDADGSPRRPPQPPDAAAMDAWLKARRRMQDAKAEWGRVQMELDAACDDEERCWRALEREAGRVGSVLTTTPTGPAA